MIQNDRLDLPFSRSVGEFQKFVWVGSLQYVRDVKRITFPRRFGPQRVKELVEFWILFGIGLGDFGSQSERRTKLWLGRYFSVLNCEFARSKKN